jgi:alpha-glucosidase (family GH31 glycosyl hydrolase)
MNFIFENFIGNGLLVYPVTEADINQVSVYFPGENTVCKENITILFGF